MTHYFFSPHADDAVLSCGGQIATLTRQGERVLVFTVMAGDPPDAFLSAPTGFAQELWTRWELPNGRGATIARRLEDQEALAILGAEVEAWPWPDAIYRMGIACGCPLYPSGTAIFDDIDPDDPVMDAILTGREWYDFDWRADKDGVFHIPLSVGGHIDHRLVRRMAQVILRGSRTANVVYYEEYPYSARAKDSAQAVQDALDRTVIWLDKAVRYRSVTAVHPVDAAALEAKIRAIACYRSQISTFWRDADDMAHSIRAYTEQIGGEREWRFAIIEHAPIQQ